MVRTLRIAADDRVVCARCRVADTFWLRFRGLMGRASLPRDEGVVFEQTGSIHMLFMRFPIDVVFCDGELRVVKVVHGLRPWRAAAARGAKVTIELAAGVADGLEPGTALTLD